MNKLFRIISISLLILSSFQTTVAQGTKELLYVNAKKVDCKGYYSSKCYQIKDAKKRSFQNWQNYPGEIRDFIYKEGFVYTIAVKKIVHEFPTTAGATYYYKLEKLIGMKPINIPQKIWKPKIHNQKFFLVSYLDAGNWVNPKEFSNYIKFDVTKKRISGNDGCNNFFGSIKSISGNNILLGPIAGTLMACPDLDNSAQKITSLLNKSTMYRVDGPDLEFYTGTTLVLKYKLADSYKFMPKEEQIEKSQTPN